MDPLATIEARQILDQLPQPELFECDRHRPLRHLVVQRDAHRLLVGGTRGQAAEQLAPQRMLVELAHQRLEAQGRLVPREVSLEMDDQRINAPAQPGLVRQASPDLALAFVGLFERSQVTSATPMPMLLLSLSPTSRTVT